MYGLAVQHTSSALAGSEVSCTGVRKWLGAGQTWSFLGVTSVMVLLGSSPLSSITAGAVVSCLLSFIPDALVAGGSVAILPPQVSAVRAVAAIVVLSPTSLLAAMFDTVVLFC